MDIHKSIIIEYKFWRSLIGIVQSTPLSNLSNFRLLSFLMREFIAKPTHLLDQIWSDKDVNIIEKTHTLGKTKFNLIDISLNGYGQEEDKKYIRSMFYRKNIRRGNTIIENPKNKYCEFARKGTPKMLDIKLEHIQHFQKKATIDKAERNIAQIIFEGVNLAFQEGKRVELIKTEKINGENAQVSYNYQFDAWIICSKNVSLLASSPNDLNIYKEPRYNYALLIANQWFKQIANLNKTQIQSLKKLLDGYTAIGQFCGHPDYQHLIRYEQVAIRWFAIVDNYTEQFCLDPLKTKKQLQKFKFKVAKMKSIILTSSSQGFYDALEKLYLKTAEAGLQDQQFGMQGSIVYFIVPQVGKNGAKQTTVGGGKLKTLQYRFFRKIREKVSRFISKRESKVQLVKKYQQQIKQLQKSCSGKSPFPHQYYIKILQAFLQLVTAAEVKQQFLRGKFISLLKIIFYALFKKISIAKYGVSMISDEAFIQKVSQIPFYKYNGLGCNTKIVYIVLGLPGMFKTYLGKKLSMHFEKISMPYKLVPIQTDQSLQKDLAQLCQKAQNQVFPLEHFYLDGSFDSQMIFKIIKYLHGHGDHKSYYKFIIIKDQAKKHFVCFDENQYPFRLETIIMSYYGQHQHKVNSPRLQDKIDNLKRVTEKLRKNANFNDAIAKLGLQQFNYPFSSKSNIEKLEQFNKIIRDILKANDEKSEFNSYAMLILRLQQIEGLDYQGQDAVNNQIEHLIKASYPSIPIINFKKSNNL